MKTMIYACVLVVGLVGCKEEVHHRQIHNVSRIFMHELHQYTLYVQQSEKEVRTEKIRLWQTYKPDFTGPDVKTDVPSNQLSWVEFDSYWKNGSACIEADPCARNVIFHLNSVAVVNGGGWDHGKYGNGQTIVVE